MVFENIKEWKKNHPGKYILLMTKITTLLTKQTKHFIYSNQKEFLKHAEQIIHSDYDVQQILTKLRDKFITYSEKSNPHLRQKRMKYRTKSKLNTIKSDILSFKGKNGTYLDIGCTDGMTVSAIQSIANFNRVYSVNNEAPRYIDGFIFQLNHSHTLPYDDNTFDLITVFMYLHKSERSLLTSELYRVLKPGGKVIIREHNVTNDETVVFLDIATLLYTHVFNSESINPKPISNNYYCVDTLIDEMALYNLNVDKVFIHNDLFQSFTVILQK